MADKSGNDVFNALVIVALVSLALKGVLSFKEQPQLRSRLEHVGLAHK